MYECQECMYDNMATHKNGLHNARWKWWKWGKKEANMLEWLDEVQKYNAYTDWFVLIGLRIQLWMTWEFQTGTRTGTGAY